MSNNFKITVMLVLVCFMISISLIMIKIEISDINRKYLEYEIAFSHSDNANFSEASSIFQKYEKDLFLKDSFSYLATYGIVLYNLGYVDASKEFFLKAANSYPKSLKENKEFSEYYKTILGGDDNEQE